ncbi:MAG: O-antigen ligase family protein [Pseudomonadota bacterium]
MVYLVAIIIAGFMLANMFYASCVIMFFTIWQPGILFYDVPAVVLLSPFKTAAILSILSWVLHKKNPIIQSPKNWALLIFIFAHAGYYLVSHPVLSSAITVFKLWLNYGILYFILANTFNTLREIRKSIFVILAGILHLIYWAHQNLYLLKIEGAPPERIYAYGMYDNANDLSLIITISLPFTIYLFSYTPKRILKFILFMIAILQVVTVFETISRAGILGVGLILFLSVYESTTISKMLKSLLIGIMITGMLVLIPYQLSKRSDAANMSGSDDSFQMRIKAWKAAVIMVYHYPLFGVGHENFRSYYKIYGEFLRKDKPAIETHNTIMHVAAESGLVGLLSFALILWFTWKDLFLILKKCKNDPEHKEMFFLTRSVRNSFLAFLWCTFFSIKEYEWFFYIILAYSTALRGIFEKTFGYYPEKDPSVIAVQKKQR